MNQLKWKSIAVPLPKLVLLGSVANWSNVQGSFQKIRACVRCTKKGQESLVKGHNYEFFPLNFSNIGHVILKVFIENKLSCFSKRALCGGAARSKWLKEALIFVISIYILYYSRIERIGRRFLALHAKMTKLILRTGCPSHRLTSWRKSAFIQLPSAQKPFISMES